MGNSHTLRIKQAYYITYPFDMSWLPCNILDITLTFLTFLCKNKTCESRLTGSESQGQEEAACVHPAYMTTSELFTASATL